MQRELCNAIFNIKIKNNAILDVKMEIYEVIGKCVKRITSGVMYNNGRLVNRE